MRCISSHPEPSRARATAARLPANSRAAPRRCGSDKAPRRAFLPPTPRTLFRAFSNNRTADRRATSAPQNPPHLRKSPKRIVPTSPQSQTNNYCDSSPGSKRPYAPTLCVSQPSSRCAPWPCHPVPALPQIVQPDTEPRPSRPPQAAAPHDAYRTPAPSPQSAAHRNSRLPPCASKKPPSPATQAQPHAPRPLRDRRGGRAPDAHRHSEG